MNFTDDFEENINILIKWLMLISLVTIILWGIINIFKFVFDKKEDSTKPNSSTEMVNENYITKSDKEIEQELLDLETTDVNTLTTIPENEENTHSEKIGNNIFQVNVNEIPEKLYFGLKTTSETLQKRKEAINKKVGENYIDSVLSYGTLERWNPASFPLKVYIEKKPNVPHNHINELKSAFLKWQERTNGFISFVFVNNISEANIICTYPNDFNRTCESSESSTTSRQFFSYDETGHIKKAHIELTYNDCNGQKYADDLVYAFSLKEVGHALGLRGHSGNFKEKTLFYYQYSPTIERPEINAADINTLKLIYSVMPDKTNIDFSEAQLNKLINPDEVWGDKVERTPASEKAILYNIEKSPDVPILHINLANYYSENGNYEKALEVYNRSLVLLNEANLKARVYIRVGDTFSSQYRYSEAAEAYKLSLKNLNEKQNIFNVYFNLGYVYYQQNKYDEALNAYQAAIQYVTSKTCFYRLLMNLSLIYLKEGDIINAQKCAEKAFSFYKTEDSLYLIAYIKYLNNNYTEAQIMLEELISKFDYSLGYALLAQIYYKTEQFNKLKDLSNKAAKIFPNNTPFSFN